MHVEDREREMSQEGRSHLYTTLDIISFKETSEWMFTIFTKGSLLQLTFKKHLYFSNLQ